VAGRSVGDVMGVAKEQKELIRRNQASSWTWTSCVHQADTGREESQSHKIRMPCLVCHSACHRDRAEGSLQIIWHRLWSMFHEICWLWDTGIWCMWLWTI